jgi:hypothetical protein
MAFSTRFMIKTNGSARCPPLWFLLGGPLPNPDGPRVAALRSTKEKKNTLPYFCLRSFLSLSVEANRESAAAFRLAFAAELRKSTHQAPGMHASFSSLSDVRTEHPKS